jgi:hypothetical protein
VILFSLLRLHHNTTAEKDENTKLVLIADKASEFLTIYGKPVYVVNGMSGQPNSLLRLGYPEVDTGLFTDDDFMMYNNVSTDFQEFIEGPYSVVMKYTGLRWLGEYRRLEHWLSKKIEI